MAESAETSGNESPTASSLPAAPSLTELRVPIAQLPRLHEAMARAWGEAGVGGQELESVFASGIRASCVSCGLSVTGAELADLALRGEDEESRDRPLPAKLERLSLGYCPRQGCESRFYQVQIVVPGRFDRGWVLGRTQQILEGRGGPRIQLRPSLSPETRRATQRVAMVALGTFLVAFVAYRVMFYRSQLIPFVQPKSPFTVEPSSIDPTQR